jgi:hypothetical protein
VAAAKNIKSVAENKMDIEIKKNIDEISQKLSFAKECL